jgi:hypothetical protein
MGPHLVLVGRAPKAGPPGIRPVLTPADGLNRRDLGDNAAKFYCVTMWVGIRAYVEVAQP